MTAFPASSSVKNSRGYVLGYSKAGEVRGSGWAQERQDLMQKRGVGAQENIVWGVLMAVRVTWEMMGMSPDNVDGAD